MYNQCTMAAFFSPAERIFLRAVSQLAYANPFLPEWVELERALASNYTGVTPGGALDRAATLDQYRSWQLKDYAIGDLKTEMNGSTIVVTYTITLNGTAGSQPLPSAPLHMMSVWQEQQSGWIEIAHSASQQ